MIINSGNIKKNVYLDEYGFSSKYSFLSKPLDVEFGLSGNSVQTFKIKSGIVSDAQNKFITFYKDNDVYSINSDGENISYLVNNYRFSTYSGDLKTGENFLIFNNKDTNTVSYTVDTKEPELSYNNITTSDYINYTGSIYNSTNQKVKIFKMSEDRLSGDVDDVSINAKSTGTFSFSTLISGNKTGNFNFYVNSNFGDFYKEIDYYNPDYTDVETGYMNLSLGNVTDKVESLAQIDYYWNKASNLKFKFAHVAGTGDVNRNVTLFNAYGSGDYSGQIDGVGYLKSTNMSGTGSYSFIHDGTVYNNLTGFYGISGEGYLYGVVAVGDLTDSFTVKVSGYEGGNMSTGDYLVSYTVTLVSGDNGVYLREAGSLDDVTPTSSEWIGGTNTSPVGLYTGQYEAKTIVKSSYITTRGQSAMGFAKAKVPIGTKDVENTWLIKSGLVGSELSDVPLILTVSGKKYYSGNIDLPAGNNSVNIGITYTNPYVGTRDAGVLIVDNGFISNYLEVYAGGNQ